MPRRDDDPVGNYNFRVEIEGVSVAHFAEVSGLDIETEVIEYRNGSDFNVRKLPGLHKFNDITLKRGITGDHALWNWYKLVLDGKVQRTTGSIILMDEDRQEVMRWSMFEVWPRRYAGSPLQATGNEVAIETLSLTAERIELAN